MSYFPVFVQLEGKQCLVVGGGSVALRKIQTLCEMGASVTVVAPQICPEIQAKPVEICRREFEERDLKDRFLVVAATDEEKINAQVAALCSSQGILVNSVTKEEPEGFLFPAVIERGSVVIGISSSGNSPALTAQLKQRLEAALPAWIGGLSDSLGAFREKLKQEVADEGVRKEIYRELAAWGLEHGEITEAAAADIRNKFL